MLLIVALTALAAGLLIGLTGIGGVLMLPVLTQVAGVPLDRAVAASLVALLVAGLYAAIVHLRRERLPRTPLVVLCATAAAGSLAGALTLDLLPAFAIRMFIAALCVASGAQVLLFRPRPRDTIPSSVLLGILGATIGYLSAVSGTGGPVTLIPLLLAVGTPVGAAVSLGLAVQVPITVFATVVYAIEGRIDPALAATLSVLLLIGTFAGAKLSNRLSGRTLANAVAATLVVVGLWYGYVTLVARLAGTAGTAGA